MGKDLNRCDFIGRLGKDVDIKHTKNGTAAANFSIACGDDYKTKEGDKIERTNWINVVVFGKLAEICGLYLSKGSQVYISGKHVTQKWQDNNGNDRYTAEIVASEMQMLGSKGDGGQKEPAKNAERPAQQQSQPQQSGGMDDFDDDIPF